MKNWNLYVKRVYEAINYFFDKIPYSVEHHKKSKTFYKIINIADITILPDKMSLKKKLIEDLNNLEIANQINKGFVTERNIFYIDKTSLFAKRIKDEQHWKII